MGITAVRVPAGLMNGWVRAVTVAAPSAGTRLIRWTSSRGQLTVKPISFSSGRCIPLATLKSRVSLMVVSVLSAMPSLWYCLNVEN